MEGKIAKGSYLTFDPCFKVTRINAKMLINVKILTYVMKWAIFHGMGITNLYVIPMNAFQLCYFLAIVSVMLQ